MSRIGNKIIKVPDGVKVKYEGRKLQVEGPKGKLEQEVRSGIDFEFKGAEKEGRKEGEKGEKGEEGGEIVVKRLGETKMLKSLHGLYRSLLSNMVHGVKEGFSRRLELNGVAYRASLSNTDLTLTVGYSHPVIFKIPEGVECEVKDNTKILLSSHDKQLLGETAARIRRIRPPEPYKRKGIKYAEEVIRTKAGKSGKK